MAHLPDLKDHTQEGYRITRRHTAVFLSPGICERCGVAVPIRFRVKDRQGEIGSVCGVCGWLVGLGRGLHIETTCRGCGCSDDASCRINCWWVEKNIYGSGLCSNCQKDPPPAIKIAVPRWKVGKVGTPSIKVGGVTIAPKGISSGESFGKPTIQTGGATARMKKRVILHHTDPRE